MKIKNIEKAEKLMMQLKVLNRLEGHEELFENQGRNFPKESLIQERKRIKKELKKL